MKTGGIIRVDGNTVPAEGRTWFDHEFGSSQLSESQEGWDWISLRMSDGSDLMVYRLRESDGSVTPMSSATLRRPDGTVRHLSADRWTMKPLEHWRSPTTGGRYPVRWRLTAEDPDLDLVIDRRFDAQEMVLKRALNPPYWEGVISAKGKIDNQSVSGEGFLEMTGYVQTLKGSF